MTSAPPQTVLRPRLLPRRLAWPRLFGPVLLYDLIRTVRQGRFFLLRAAYILALLLVLFLVYLDWFGGSRNVWRILTGVGRVRDEANLKLFAGHFFLLFSAVQLGTVFLLTPAYTASAIADEREKGTLDYLLASDLTSREIVLGKLTSRLLTLFLVLLAGLPVLGFLQLIGGVDPNLVVAGFVSAAATTLSLGGLGVYISVRAERPRGAVFATYAFALAYLLLSLLLVRANFSLYNPLHWVGAGNVFVAYRRAMVGAGGISGAAVLPVLRDYVLVHGIVALVFVSLAARRLRPGAARGKAPSPVSLVRPHILAGALDDSLPFDETVAVQPRWGTPPLVRPRVGEEPILWKELYAERGLTLPPLARGLVVLAAGSVFAVATIVFLCGIIITIATGGVATFANLWVRIVGTPLALLLVVAVGVRASTAFSGERDRQTLDNLLTTPLDNRAILAGKWLGSVLAVRDLWWPLALVWLLGMMAGGVHLLSLVMLIMAWTTYAAFAASVGLWFSLHSRTSLRATIWTLVTLLAVGAGEPVMWLTGYPLAAGLEMGLGVHPAAARDFAHFGLTPPASLASLTFPFGDWYSFDPRMRTGAGEVGLAWAGICAYAVAAAALWALLRLRFGAVTGRMPSGRVISH